MPNSQHFTLKQRLRYRFDNTLSRGMWAVLLWLGLIASIFFVVIALILTVLRLGPGDESTTLLEGIWFALTRSLDPGTFSGDEGIRFRLIMLVVTFAGIFLAATIIGLVSSAIDNRVETLRRGRSLVVETGHTLIIGLSDKLNPIVSELVEANASERGRAIVVLTTEDTVEVTEDIKASVTDLKTSRLVVRSGVTTRITDLLQGNPAGAKSVIVLRAADGTDAQVVKTVLALSRCVPDFAALTVVAELEDADTAEALTLAVGPSLITVTPRDIIARIGAQVSRASGLGAIYQEFLDFEGDELYSIPVTGQWLGRRFGEVLLGSSRGTIIGMRSAAGPVMLNPSPVTVLAAGDSVIGIAEDDSVFSLDVDPVEWLQSEVREQPALPKAVERTLLIGWSDLAPLIALEIEAHVALHSELHVLVDQTVVPAELVRSSIHLSQQALIIHDGDPIAGSVVERVLAQGPFDHIMLLSERGTFTADEADARTLLALMHVRRFTAGEGDSQNIVAELMDPNDVELGGNSDNNDFIVSQRLIGLLMAQLSESPHLRDVFADLFDSDGSVVAMHPFERYLPFGSYSFADVIRAAREWGVVPIGYRAASAVGDPLAVGNGIRLNPSKDAVVSYADGDVLVLIAQT
ncbi:MAG: hypothetical protein Q8M73_09975 [Actinomycetota bacterium]|nr:hypothetical protein [Actinomycetota bacterium]